jgi:hypothetical protein
MTNIIKNTIVGAALTLFSGAFLISAASLYHDADRRRVKAGAESCWQCRESSDNVYFPVCFTEDGKEYTRATCVATEASWFVESIDSPGGYKDKPQTQRYGAKCENVGETVSDCGKAQKCTASGEKCNTNGG